MTWFIWILISVVATAGSNIFQRVLMREKDSDPYGTAVIFQFVIALFSGIFAVWSGFVFPPIGTYFWNFLAGTFLWGIGSLLLFYAYQIVEASEIVIISALGSIVTILTAVMLLGETFTIQKVFGTVLILASIVLINWKKGAVTLGKGTAYAIIATVLYGCAVTNDAFILRTYNAISYTPVISLLPGILLLVFRPWAAASVLRLANKKFLKNMTLLGIFYAAQSVAYYIALQSGRNASQIAPIYKSNIILTVLLSIIFLKERKNIGLKLFTGVVVTLGVLLIK
jgi:uncharacterized membrane protein